MHLAVAPPTPRTLAVLGHSERFPVHRIFCVGRNYAAHAHEMGGDEREPPFFFMKPASAAVDASAPATIAYPPKTKNFHHEIELVVAIAKGGADIPVASALEHVYGYAIGLDMTRRDLQLALRDKGRPWEFGKSFADSAPIGAVRRVPDGGHIKSGAIRVDVNGTTKQSSDVSLLIWSVAECIAQLSQYDRLEAGDLIMTGTPEGVAAVKPGEEMLGAIEGLGEIRVRVAG
jgi:fumarylpyruvate hydrolase